VSDTEQELTLEEAYKVIKKLIVERDSKLLADMQWMSANITASVSPDANQTQQIEAKISQRNQVLFSVGYIEQDKFRYSDIEAFIRQRFPNSNQGAVLNIAHAMSEIAGNETGVLKRTPKGDGYMLKAPILGACLRAMLRCEEGSEVVQKVALTFS
jgi:hypothetical protein